MGRKVDPANPLYGGEMSEGAEAEVPPPVAEVPQEAAPVAPVSDLEFDLESTSPVSRVTQQTEPEPTPDLEPEPEPEPEPESEPEMPVQEPLPEPEPITASALDFDLGGDDVATQATDVGLPSSSATQTVVLERNALEQAEARAAMADSAAGLDFDLGHTMPGPDTVTDVAVVDLEKTDIGNLVDFNFEMSDAEPKPAEPVIDLSDISLDLPDLDAPQTIAPQPEAALEAPPSTTPCRLRRPRSTTPCKWRRAPS